MSDLPSVLDELFGTGLSQNARLVTLATAQGSKLPESMAVEAFRGHEAVNQLFRFDIDVPTKSTLPEAFKTGGPSWLDRP